MRSPQIQFSISPKRLTTTNSMEASNKNNININHNYDNDDDSTTSTTVSFHSSTKSKSSFTPPQPRASLSSFAAPSWNNGSIGEHSSNVRVVARIKPIDRIRTSSNNSNKEAIFAIPSSSSSSNDHDDDDDGYINTDDTTNTSPIPFKSPSSRKGVADIAARFNTNSSPIAPPNNNSYTMITTSTTPTKFMKSPSRIPSVVGSATKTPIHTNVNVHEKYKNNIIPSTSLRQSFIPPPTSPSLSVTSGTGGSNVNNTYTKQSTVQTISAGLTDPKQFDFDAVS